MRGSGCWPHAILAPRRGTCLSVPPDAQGPQVTLTATLAWAVISPGFQVRGAGRSICRKLPGGPALCDF